MKCGCGENLRLVVKTEHRSIYSILEDGTLEHYDSDGGGQEFSLECGECINTYEFLDEEGYFEIQDQPQLYSWWFRDKGHSGELVKQNINKLKIIKK